MFDSSSQAALTGKCLGLGLRSTQTDPEPDEVPAAFQSSHTHCMRMRLLRPRTSPLTAIHLSAEATGRRGSGQLRFLPPADLWWENGGTIRHCFIISCSRDERLGLTVFNRWREWWGEEEERDWHHIRPSSYQIHTHFIAALLAKFNMSYSSKFHHHHSPSWV